MSVKRPTAVERTTAPARGQLRNSMRWALTAVSVGALGAGGVAVFESQNELGTTSLLAVGLIAGLVAVTGRTPLGIKVGDVEMLLADAVAAEDDGDEEAARVLEERAVDAVRSARVGSAAFRDRLPAADFELAVFQALADGLPSDARIALQAVPDEGIVDGIIQVAGRSVGVEARAGTKFRAADLVRRFREAIDLDVLDIDAFLVVVQTLPGDAALRTLEQAASRSGVPIRVVGWLAGETTSQLRADLDILLRRPE